jgi:formylmethanofuran dehydrogenase subunit E
MRMGDTDEKEVAREVMMAERDIVSWQRVRVAPYEKIKRAPLVTCSSCGETHPATDGNLCIRCHGKENYYEVTG